MNKIINCIGRNGSRISIRPETIVAAQPDENLIGETMILVACGSAQVQLFVKMPHEQFARIWEAALNGRDALLN